MILKCHWCQKELEPQPKDHLDPPGVTRWECKDTHLLVAVQGDTVIEYTMFWFEEDKGIKNKLIANSAGTTLYVAHMTPGASFRRYSKAVEVPQFISLIMDGNQVLYGNVIPRLRKLVAFS